MSLTQEELSMLSLYKGSFVGAQVFGNVCELWFSSPTGDSSDSIVMSMQCESAEQASDIAEMHRKVWGLLSL